MDETTVIEERQAHRRRIGHLGGLAIKEKHGSPYFRRLGKRGGDATKASQDTEYYARIGRIGAHAKHRNWVEAQKAGVSHG